MYILNLSPKLVSIQEAAEFLGVAPQTLRRWESEGNLLPDEPTAGGRRRYDLALLQPDQFRAPEKIGRTIAAYARVSSHDQKDDLEGQKQVLELFCAPGKAGHSS
nr:MerR family DNA-binding transcriptional regulator [Methylacidiphilum sp. Yel]